MLRLSDTLTCIPSSNTDISGIGVRVSFYFQFFLLVLLVDRSWEDAPTALWTFIATSFGLSIAAIAQKINDSGNNKLTLFQALIVSNLVWLANFGTSLSLATMAQRAAQKKRLKRQATLKARRGKLNAPARMEGGEGEQEEEEDIESGRYIRYAAMAQTIFSIILTFAMWSHVHDFTPDDLNGTDCTPYIRYILFAWHVDAVVQGRIVGLLATAIVTVLYVAMTVDELYKKHLTRRRHRLSKQKHRMELEAQERSQQEQDTEPEQAVTTTVPQLNTEAPYRRSEATFSAPPASSNRATSTGIPVSILLSSRLASENPYITRSSGDALKSSAGERSHVQQQQQQQHPGSNSRRHHQHGTHAAKNRRKQHQHKPKHKRWLLELDPMLVGLFFVQLAILTYFIVSTELMLAYNHAASNSNDFTQFGQILAIIAVLPSLGSLIVAFKKNGFKRVDRKEPTERRRRRGLRQQRMNDSLTANGVANQV